MHSPLVLIPAEALDVSLFVDEDFGEAFDKIAKDGFLDAEDVRPTGCTDCRRLGCFESNSSGCRHHNLVGTSQTLGFMTELFHGPLPGPELARIRERLADFVGSSGERGRATRAETIALMAQMRDEADATAKAVGDPHSDMKRDPKEYSYDALCEKRRRGQNPFLGPKDELLRPLTMNQEVGWTLEAGDEGEVLAELKPKTKSDATKYAETPAQDGRDRVTALFE